MSGPEFEWLGVLRHSQSIANVAAEAAEAGGLELIDVGVPDARVDLTGHGRTQAQAVGEWLANAAPDQRPVVVVGSSYVRARATADIVAQALGGVPVELDERLRDRELGILDRLTRRGVAARFPEENARREFVGRFYYRPPGGESWADVVGRLRAALTDLRAAYDGCRVLLVSHEAVVFLAKYVIERLDVAQLEDVARHRLANAGLTTWRNVDGVLKPESFDDTTPLNDLATRQPHV